MQVISAIIRTKNSDKTLQQCLNHLMSQSLKVDEIIVVDSGSTDTTLEIAEKNACTIVYYPKNLPFNYSKAINIGIQAAKGDYIFMLSSHFILWNEHTIQTLYSFLSMNSRIGGASIFPPYGKKKKVVNTLNLDWEIITKSNFQGFALSNTCCIFRRLQWEKYAFNEQIPTVEDQEWAYHFMKIENLGFVTIKNYPADYANPYHNTKKHLQEAITLGRYVYPPHISWKKGVQLFFYNAWIDVIKGRIPDAQNKFQLGFSILKEHLGLNKKLSSTYNKKLAEKDE